MGYGQKEPLINENVSYEVRKLNETKVFAGITALGFTNIINNQQALDLLKSAVVKKHIPSMIEIGLCYSSGTLVEKNILATIRFHNFLKLLGYNSD